MAKDCNIPAMLPPLNGNNLYLPLLRNGDKAEGEATRDTLLTPASGDASVCRSGIEYDLSC
jgi:hypothetical protein